MQHASLSQIRKSPAKTLTTHQHHTTFLTSARSPATDIYQRRRSTKLQMNLFQRLASKGSKKESSGPAKVIQILDHIGSGSYGTVHKAQFADNGGSGSGSGGIFVAKRAWTQRDLQDRPQKTRKEGDTKMLKGRAERCKYYLDVEQHCLGKITTSSDKENKVRVPKFLGKYKDDSIDDAGYEWLLFEMITRSKDDTRIARSLKAVMNLDWIKQHQADGAGDDERHHLYLIKKELKMDESATFEDTLDVVFKGLLNSVVGVHEMNVVNRDIKPDNLLIDGENQVRRMLLVSV